MNKGKIKFYNKEKGFGFIIPDNKGKDIFFHKTGLIDEVNENDEITFETKQGNKGIEACEIEVV